MDRAAALNFWRRTLPKKRLGLMIISLIVAMDRRGVISAGGALPWRLLLPCHVSRRWIR